MNFKYICEGFSDMTPSEWIGEISPLLPFDPEEFEVSARGSRFHLILSKHSYGKYLYISNLGIGMDMAGLNEREWNLSHLLEQHPQLQLADAISITDALVAIEKHYNEDNCD